MRIFKKKSEILDQLSLNNELRRRKEKSKLKEKLRKSSEFFRGAFSFLFSDGVVIDDELKEKIFENFIKLDFGEFLSERFSTEIAKKISSEKKDPESIKFIFKKTLKDFYFKEKEDLKLNIQNSKLNVLLIVGSNGSGKTTTIAKIANKYKSEYKVLLVAADTFRAGAPEQLKKWADQLELEIILPKKEKEDPASLIYKSLQLASEKGFNLVICDTSGKQHNNENLMRELEKIYKTVHKFDLSWPSESLLVIDSTIGQYSFFQAESFLKSANISGIILSKVDTLRRGGSIFFIKDKFNIPVKYICTGERLEDLHEFNLDDLIEAWFNELKLKTELILQ